MHLVETGKSMRISHFQGLKKLEVVNLNFQKEKRRDYQLLKGSLCLLGETFSSFESTKNLGPSPQNT
jgi:hypothetical protein